MALRQIRNNKSPGAGLFSKIIRATAKKNVDPTADVGFHKCRPRLPHNRRRVGRQPPILRTGLHLHTPRLVQLIDPVILKRSEVFALEEPRDFTRTAQNPPINRNGFSGPRFVPGAEATRIFVANRFIMRRDNYHRFVGIRHRHLFRAQQKRHPHDGHECEEQKGPFHRLGKYRQTFITFRPSKRPHPRERPWQIIHPSSFHQRNVGCVRKSSDAYRCP